MASDMGRPSVAHVDPLDQWSERSWRVPFECPRDDGEEFLVSMINAANIMSENTTLTRGQCMTACMRALGWLSATANGVQTASVAREAAREV